MARSLKLDDALDARIHRLANDTNRSPDAIVTEAVQQYVDREETIRLREQTALDALRHYRETGLHLTGEELEDWLDTWGSEAQVDAPPCHK